MNSAREVVKFQFVQGADNFMRYSQQNLSN